MTHSSGRIGAAAAILALAISGCNLMTSKSTADRLAAEKVSTQSELADTRSLATEKDSLLTALLETTTLLGDINQAVSAIQSGHASPLLAESGRTRPMTTREARALLLPKIDSLRLRLQEAEARVGGSLDRVHQLSGGELRLRQQVADYERTVASVRKLLAAQQAQVLGLGSEVESLRAENRRLLDEQGRSASVQGALRDSVTDLRESQNTVYWVAGSRNALLELRVVVEEGSSKFLVFGKGKRVDAARSFHASDFTPVNKEQSRSIALPNPRARYRILTRQDLTAVGNLVDRDGHVRGTLEITDPDRFWQFSPYLILLEDN